MHYRQLSAKLSSLFILRNLNNFATVKAMVNMLRSTNASAEEFCAAYSDYMARSLKKPLDISIMEAVHYDENLICRHIRNNTFHSLPNELKASTDYDLNTISQVLNVTSEEILSHMAKKHPDWSDILLSMPKYTLPSQLSVNSHNDLIEFYRKNGYGFFAKGTAYYFEDNLPHKAPTSDPITLSELWGYEKEKAVIIQNTKAFLSGKPCNNMLLYGDKGTGKSSTVKAVVNEFADRGLKIIEVKLNQIENFPRLYGYIAASPFKFIVLLDDISFSELDNTYSSLKAFIEGGVTAKPENMIIYATSNRKNMVVEKISDREGDEVRVRDAMQSASSLSDRFGVEVTFFNLDKPAYLALVKELCNNEKIAMEENELFLLAERFATYKSGRSPRTARQFINDLLSKADD